MTSAPLFIVINAGSGQAAEGDAAATIAGVLAEAGRVHRLLSVEAPSQLVATADEAVRLARAAGGVVVAAGGDGTVGTVAARALEAELPFGVLPRGTFNLFAREHGVPEDLADATRALLGATPVPVQVGRANGRPFLVNASLGLYPHLLEEREEALAEHGRGRAVAYWSGLRTLFDGFPAFDLRIESGGLERTVRTTTLFVGNNRLQLRRLGIDEAAIPTRGKLAALVVRPIGQWAMVALALRGALGTLGDDDRVETFAFRRLTVAPRGRDVVKLALDGEVVEVEAPVVFDVSPQPLRLLLPASDARAAAA